MGDIEILDEKVVYQNGSFKRVHRWLRGAHPTRGTIVRGLTGWETLEERDVIVAMKTYQVIDLTPSVVEIAEITEEKEHGEGQL